MTPHPPQFAVSAARFTQRVPHMMDVSSVTPSQLSSMPLHWISTVDVGVHAQRLLPPAAGA